VSNHHPSGESRAPHQAKAGELKMSNQTDYLCTKTRPEGYNGNTVTVFLVFDRESGKTLEVHPLGWHVSPVVPAPEINAASALWRINNDPLAKEFYS
jgi:hypothetical protein